MVLVCDRYRAYKRLALDGEELILACCGAQGRRDFLQAARSWPQLESWLGTGVDASRALCHLHAARVQEWDAGVALEQPSSALEAHQGNVGTQRSQRQARCEAHLREPELPLAQPKVLNSWHKHWDGLTVCVARPEGAMDHNTAERLLRHPVVGRKNS